MPSHGHAKPADAFPLVTHHVGNGPLVIACRATVQGVDGFTNGPSADSVESLRGLADALRSAHQRRASV